MQPRHGITLKPRRRREPVRAIDAVIDLFALTLFVTGMLGVYDVIADPGSPARAETRQAHLLTPPPRGLLGFGKNVSLLLVGADDRGDRGRADAIMVAYISPRTQRAALLSIQRDTRVSIPGHRTDKINHAYRFGGAPLLKLSVEKLLGERLDGYAKLDFQTFKEAVDILGGVTILVPDVEGKGRGMNYDDNADGLHIHLRPGEQRMDGQAAMGYVRYRRDSDIKRTQRQREFLKALVRQHSTKKSLAATLRAARHVIQQIDTDVPAPRAAGVLSALSRIPPESIKTAMLPVKPARSGGVYYSDVAPKEAGKLRADLRAFLEGDGAAPLRVKECAVLVLNGSGREGVAAAAAERLRRRGATIAATRNAGAFSHTRTEVRYHALAQQAAHEMVRALPVTSPVMKRDDEFDAPGAASVIITIGTDFEAR